MTVTPIDFPAARITDVRWSLESNTLIFESPLSKQSQRLELTGARWAATFTLTPYKKNEVGAILAFLVKLRGAANTFYAYDPDRKTPQGVGTGTPLVNGASQTGTSLITDGWTAGQTGILKAGDYFQVGTELKMITQDIDSDGSGNATLVFEPALRASPSDNAAITVNTPKCIMRLIDDNQTGWDTNINSVYGITFSAVETFI